MAEHGEAEPFDLFIIGGGVNGAGIARDAAGRGLRVALSERDDLAGATSSASSKLVHGGLRYLEHGQFRLVREALSERETLMRIAPHLVRPLRIVMPHRPGQRPAWQIRLGLFLYDHLGARSALPGSAGVDLASAPLGAGLRPAFRRGFAFSDCRVDDSRLVILNARDAAGSGALVMTRNAAIAAERAGALWRVTTSDRRVFRARALVNTAGPWTAEVAASAGVRPRHRLRLVKGSHLVVPQLYRGEHAYILPSSDRRIVFVIPFEERFSLIGTTEVTLDGPPQHVAITREEIDYLRRVTAEFLDRSFRDDEIAWTYSGIRPLYDDGKSDASAVTRDYTLEIDDAKAAAPLLSVFGGKITTYRRLAEQALAALNPWFPRMAPPWTATRPLPGGDLGIAGMSRFVAQLAAAYPGLPAELLPPLARRHGSLAGAVLGDARGPADLGRHFGGGLYEREVEHFVRHEWARTAEDILWRRSKAGLLAPPEAAAAIEDWIAARRPAATPLAAADAG